VRDGKLCSSAGITAGIDLALALLEEYHGRGLALKVARFLCCSSSARRPGAVLDAAAGAVLLGAGHWAGPAVVPGESRGRSPRRRTGEARRHERAQLPPRLPRGYRRTPGEFVAAARLQAACRLLEESDIALNEVAQRCGLGTAATMRRLFLQRLGVAPVHYRDKFRVREVGAER